MRMENDYLMADFNIFEPQVSSVAKGLEGKVITIVGSNSLGKTKQATRMSKPFYLGFEKGIRAIAGIPFLPINKWTDFKKINKQLTDPKTLDKAKERYQTLIFDEVYTSALYCQDFLCKKHGVETIGDGNDGFGLWKEYETEYWAEIDKLLNSGYTLVFISHEDHTKEGKAIPKGDKRSIKPIIDNSDVVAYLTSNGIDENGKVIKSSAWFAETPQWFARTRFDYMTTHITEFTAENLEAAIADGIRLQEEAEGIVAVSYDEQKESYKSQELNYDEIVKQIAEKGNALATAGFLEDVVETVEKHLGKGVKYTDAKPSQVDLLSLIVLDLTDLEDTKLSA